MKYNEIYSVYMPYIETEKFGLGSGLMLKTFGNEFHAYTFTKWMVVFAPNENFPELYHGENKLHLMK